MSATGPIGFPGPDLSRYRTIACGQNPTCAVCVLYVQLTATALRGSFLNIRNDQPVVDCAYGF
jgi:hypothetical protein